MFSAILSLAIFLVYIVCLVRYYRTVPKSLSETYYILGLNDDDTINRLKASIFTFTLWAMGLLLIVPLVDVTPDEWRFLAFLTIAAIGFVGAAPEFRTPSVNRIHTGSAVFAAISGIAWAIIVGRRAGIIGIISSILICLTLSLASRSLKRSYIWWLEMTAFGSIYITLFWMI